MTSASMVHLVWGRGRLDGKYMRQVFLIHFSGKILSQGQGSKCLGAGWWGLHCPGQLLCVMPAQPACRGFHIPISRYYSMDDILRGYFRSFNENVLYRQAGNGLCEHPINESKCIDSLHSTLTLLCLFVPCNCGPIATYHRCRAGPMRVRVVSAQLSPTVQHVN